MNTTSSVFSSPGKADAPTHAPRVLLVSMNRCDLPYPVFPLGLAHIDAALQNNGYSTRWVDFQDSQESPERTLLPVVNEFAPDFIGISVRNIDDVIISKRHTFFPPLVSLCREIREAQSRTAILKKPAPIILGGSGFSIFPEQLLALSGADFGIHGEGEASFVALLDALRRGSDYSNIPGLVHRRDGNIVKNATQCGSEGRGGFQQAVPHYGPPQRPNDIVAYYLQQSSILNIQTQRGCSHRCCYCTYPLIEGRAWRRRSAEAVANELEELQRLGARYVFVADSVFNSSPGHVRAICEAILSRDINLSWGCFLRPKNLTEELMSLMARAGLKHIEFGSDSFCDEVLAAYGKRFTFGDVLHSSELARQQGIDQCHFLVCGGPGETRDTLATSFYNSLRLGDAVIMALIGMRIYPGTPLHARALRENVISTETDLLEPKYYLSSSVTEAEVSGMLKEFSAQSSNWIAAEPTPAYNKMAARLRAKGMIGPSWTYFAMMRRLGLTEHALTGATRRERGHSFPPFHAQPPT